MAELKLPRLLAAAKEFNVGQDTLIDFLKGKGFPKDELKPTSKLTEEMYRSLQLEYQTDKAAKIKSDQLELPKGTVIEAKKKKEEEEIIFKKEERATPKIIKKEEEVKPVTEVVVEKPAKEKTETNLQEEKLLKPEVSEIEGPKVVKKIDLSKIDSSTRPKKGVKAQKELPAETKEVTPIAIGAGEEEKPAKGKAKKGKKETSTELSTKIEEEVIAKQEPVAEEHQTVIENIEVEKLTGPKILG